MAGETILTTVLPAAFEVAKHVLVRTLPAALAAVFIAAEAGAYCLATTCDPIDPTAANACQYDSTGCPMNGFALHWPEACVAFSTQRDASPLRGITFDTMEALTSDAYYAWSQGDCGGGVMPSIGLFMRSPVNCDRVEYNRDATEPNANIWMFRDQEWPHPGTDTLALTTVTFDPDTGEIMDADVEINSADLDITVGDTRVYFDLASIIQHEAGHTLGLFHSAVVLATMYEQYTPREVGKRSLSADDIAGICAAYPPGEDRGACDPTPDHGFSTECRDSVTSSGGAAGLAGNANSGRPASTGGSPGAAGATGGAPFPADQSVGCSCHAVSSPGSSSLPDLALSGLLALFLRRAVGRRSRRAAGNVAAPAAPAERSQPSSPRASSSPA